MRAGPAEIRWHSTQPIYSVDFSAIPADEYKKQYNPYERGAKSAAAELQAWRLATAGGDNQVRLWLVTPTPNSVAAPKAGPSGSNKAPDPAKVEYLSTLSKHNAVVNCVRFSPFGTTLASASDDGTIILWTQGEKQTKESFGSDLTDELAYAREFWKVKRIMRNTQQEVYDLAWSPDGEMIVAGSTDNTARVMRANDGTVLQQITDHNNYVQGVAWDPLNNFIATQSSDRHMHVYGLKHSSSGGSLSISLVGKNSKMDVRQQRAEQEQGAAHQHGSKRIAAPAPSLPGPVADSVPSASTSNGEFRPPPPRRSASRQSDSDRSESGSQAMQPPAPGAAASSRRSSFTGSPPPPLNRRPARSPSPVPPLPAIRPPVDHAPSSQPAAPTPGPSSAGTSAGGIAPPAVPMPRSANIALYGGQEISPFFRRLAWSTDGSLLLTPAGLFADPFTAKEGKESGEPPKKKQKKADGDAAPAYDPRATGTDAKPTVYIYTRAGVANAPIAHLPGHKTGTIAIRFNPILFSLRKKTGNPKHVTLQNTVLDGEADARPDGGESGTAGEAIMVEEQDEISPTIRLPHRMVYAVATHDSVLVYDTQQATPLCYFGNLHYAPFTDVAWSADGHTLVLASQDGYCSLVAFAKGELGEPLPDGRQAQRPDAPVEPAASTPAPAPAPAAPSEPASEPAASAAEGDVDAKGKKRRVALTFEGPIA